jgi:hypothetical protein
MTDDTRSIADDLRIAVDSAYARLTSVPDETSARKPAPNTWSAKEVIGHLIDSASNNHGRFVRAQLADDLLFLGYDQDGWVTSQGYQYADWRELLDLWRSFNHQIARVIEGCPREQRFRPRVRHNLHQIAFREVPESESTTLEYFMRDYVDHLEHHLRQVFERTGIDGDAR